jgi:plastocyanin domain-containing protein
MANRNQTATVLWASAFAVAFAVGCSKSESPPSPPTVPLGEGATQVTVDAKGFSPSHVRVEKGKPASLVFVRTSDGTCAKQVVFPELKMEKDLPLNTPVAINVPTDQARTLTFQCGMGMYQSSVVIE